jgi:hypothetical protein
VSQIPPPRSASGMTSTIEQGDPETFRQTLAAVSHVGLGVHAYREAQLSIIFRRLAP